MSDRLQVIEPRRRIGAADIQAQTTESPREEKDSRNKGECVEKTPAGPNLTPPPTGPTQAELTAARRAAHSLTALARARVLYAQADADDDARHRNYLVLTKPNVILNDIGLRALAVAGKQRRRSQEHDNHEQIARNLRRSPRSPLIQTEGWDRQPAACVANAQDSPYGDSA